MASDTLPLLEEGVTSADQELTELNSDDPSVVHSPPLLGEFDGIFNKVIRQPLNHSRGDKFYTSFSEEEVAILVSVVTATYDVYDVVSELVTAHKEGTLEVYDPIIGLGYNIVSAVEMGYELLSPVPFQLPEELSIANTVLGLAEMITEVKESKAHPSLMKLRSLLLDFEAIHPTSLQIGYSSVLER